jgi:bacterioferritin-associated ferredoxin
VYDATRTLRPQRTGTGAVDGLLPAPAAMIVCLCHRISDRDIRGAVADGVRCFEQLQDDTRLAASCGSCMDCAREVFDGAVQAANACGAAAQRPVITLHAVPA